ncbi:hypothetical protein [Flavobacterium filum]|mgnify:CR=1 FL=1|uniref:hypothetical protein n=1 Tax=Flavobacterium filum TaxID=370974 RepID=UPI0023F1FD76|nr:hypothetical protein [Flavobacterium filum]
MAHFFNYDKGENRHRIYGFEVKNENDELVGYRPVVQRYPKNGGISEQISDQYPLLKWKIFSTEKLARDFAIEFFGSL